MKNSSVRIKSIIIVLIVAAAFFSNHAAAAEYRLGVALGLSGTGFLYCKDGLNAIKLAIDEINAEGGFLKQHKIDLFVKDTKTDPDTALKETRDLIEKENVRCILGTYSSACSIKIKPLCREKKVLHIPAISNSESITMTDFSPYTFSVVPNSYMQAKAVVLGVAEMAKKKGWKRYVTIASDYDWGRSTQKNTTELLKAATPDLELELVKEFWPPLGETRFTPYVMAIDQLNPDFIYGVIASKDNFAWMNQAKAAGLFKRIPYPGSLISVTELMTQKNTLERGMIGLCRAPFFAHMDEPAMTAFVEKFKAKYGNYPSDWAVMEYDAVQALKQGVEKAGSIDSEKVKDALKGAVVETCRGKLKFREIDNQLECSSYIGVVEDDEKYPFPIYKDLIEIKGPDSMRPESEIIAARKALE